MKKRNITVAAIALILLIAIGITIAFGGEANAAPVSVGALASRTLNQKALGLQRTTLAPSLLGGSAAVLKNELLPGLDAGLTSELRAELNSLTASADGLALRLGSVNRLSDVAALTSVGKHLENGLGALLRNA